MAQLLPITLTGDNLGQRHRYLNSYVNKAAADLVSFQDIERQPELSPVDRIFKIDLANKLKNVDYIIKNIKDDDMLYVSRALKCKWLLEDHDTINPKYLENVLYPEMILPAISKMKHWLYINMRDTLKCQEFYLHYKDTNFEYAIKFLNQCGNEFILDEFPKILTKVRPHYLKVLGEKDPKLVKIYYDSLATDSRLIEWYLREEQKFYNKIKFMLKIDPDTFLDITEKYHSLAISNKLSSSATEYILRFHKGRFMAKPELYVVYLLDMTTVARCLSVEECQDIVIQLARADYLKSWFSYAKVEPLIKRLDPDKRAAFKKRVFIKKDVGEHVSQWPYALPVSPIPDETSSVGGTHAFEDLEFQPILMLRRIAKLKGRDNNMVEIISTCPESDPLREKSELQKLFDEFRFVGFEGTLYELKRRVFTMSSPDRRRDVLLVLLSKSGGRAEAVRAMLDLAVSLKNEPVHLRASVVRSLVNRAWAWRLPQDVWESMLEYGHGLGLDGTKSEAECIEGLHAVVMRQLIVTGNCESTIRSTFLDNFTTFEEYKLEKNERAKIRAGLQRILMNVVVDVKPNQAANYLGLLLDVLQTYCLSFNSSPVVSAIAELAEKNFEAAKPLLIRLYNGRVGRRELFPQFLKCRPDDASFLNALRHDPCALTPDWLVKILMAGKTRATQFLSKLTVYFAEKRGIADSIRQVLLEKIAVNRNIRLARPLTILAGSDIMTVIQAQDMAVDKHIKFKAALRANMHRARPAPDSLALGWRKVGMKAIANCAMRCRPAQITQLVQSLLDEKIKRTVRLVLALAPRTVCTADLFAIASTIHPVATLRAAFLYFRRFGADMTIWDTVKPLILKIDLDSCKYLRYLLRRADFVPKSIKPDYCAFMYLALIKLSSLSAEPILNELMKLLPEVSDDLLETVMLRILKNMDKETPESNPESYPAIIIRYLMLSKSIDELETRFSKIGEPFFNRLDAFREGKVPSKPHFLSKNYDQIIACLQYNYAFFDFKYECLPVIERILTWLQNCMSEETHFNQYVKIHAVMLYYKAVRHSMKQQPEVFDDHLRRGIEGLDIVGFTFGTYIASELKKLISKYFDSVIEIYCNAFRDYLNEYFLDDREKFAAAVAKGILSARMGKEAQLAVNILNGFGCTMANPLSNQVRELIMQSENKETQFFLHAELIV